MASAKEGLEMSGDHFLITYIPLKGHKDPDYKVFTYGDSGRKGRRLKRKDPAITCDARVDYWVFVGDPKMSKRFRKPVPLDKQFCENVTLGLDFSASEYGTRTELAVISSVTRQPRQLDSSSVKSLLAEIERHQGNAKVQNPNEVQHHLYFYDESEEFIPLDEVHKLREAEIQKLIRKAPSMIETGARVIDYEKVLPDGDRLDLLLEAQDGSIIVAELKVPGKTQDEIVTQVASYAADVEKQFPDRRVRKMIICDGNISPKLEKACKNLGVEVVVYGVKLGWFKLD